MSSRPRTDRQPARFRPFGFRGGPGLGNHALHLPRSDHPGFVDDQDMTIGQQLSALRPLMFETGDRPRLNAGAAFQIFRSDAG